MSDLTTIIDNTRTSAVQTAEDMIGKLDEALSLLQEALQADGTKWLGFSGVGTGDVLGDTSLVVDPGSIPTPVSPDLAQKYFPQWGIVSPDAIAPIRPVTMPVFTAVAPPAPSGWSGGAAPSFSGSTPSLYIPNIPAPSTPVLPVFERLTSGVSPDLSPVSFTYELPSLPSFNGDVGLDGFVYSEEEYESALKDAATAWLQDIITNGGTGLHPDIETAIWDRATSREVAKAHQELEATVDEFAMANFPMPPGALQASLRKVRSNLQDRLDDLNRDIAIEQARMAKAATEFAISKSLELEAILIQHFDRVADRALQVAKAAVEYAKALLDARVAAFNAQVEAFRMGVEGSKFELEKAKLEITMRGFALDVVKADADLARTSAEIYKARVDAVSAVAGLEKLRVEAAVAMGELEKLKIEEFKAKVLGYEAELRGYEAEAAVEKLKYEGYRAEVEGYTALAQAYRAEVEGKAEEIRGEVARVQAESLVAKAKADAIVEKNKGEAVALQADLERIKAFSQGYANETAAYKSVIDAHAAAAQVSLGKWGLVLEARRANTAERNAKYRAEGEIFSRIAEAKIGAAAGAHSSVSAAAAAALSQITAITQGVTTEDIT